MTPAERVTALEAEFSRLKARADTLDRIIEGSSDEWLGIQEKLGSDIAEVTINAPMAEARQTALALATIGKALAALGAGEQAPAASSDAGDQVAARRETKLKEARERVARDLAEKSI
jgi:hypothetical protein